MRAMTRIRWLGLAVILVILAAASFNRLASPWNVALAGLALVLGCVALAQEVRRARS
jgi:general stress protein CsbA